MLQADTIIPDGPVTQSMNRYSYVFNNPLSYTDPSGHVPQDGMPNQISEGFGGMEGASQAFGGFHITQGQGATQIDFFLDYLRNKNSQNKPATEGVQDGAIGGQQGKMYGGETQVEQPGEVQEANTTDGILENQVDKNANEEEIYKIIAVAHLANFNDPYGHSFVILVDKNGTMTARGFYPDDIDGGNYDIIMLTGKEINGMILDESTSTNYLNNYLKWSESGIDPNGGFYSHKEFNINKLQYENGLNAIKNWDTTYSIYHMCGNFTNDVINATGNRLFDQGSEYYDKPPAPLFLYKSFGGNYDK